MGTISVFRNFSDLVKKFTKTLKKYRYLKITIHEVISISKGHTFNKYLKLTRQHIKANLLPFRVVLIIALRDFL